MPCPLSFLPEGEDEEHDDDEKAANGGPLQQRTTLGERRQIIRFRSPISRTKLNQKTPTNTRVTAVERELVRQLQLPGGNPWAPANASNTTRTSPRTATSTNIPRTPARNSRNTSRRSMLASRTAKTSAAALAENVLAQSVATSAQQQNSTARTTSSAHATSTSKPRTVPLSSGSETLPNQAQQLPGVGIFVATMHGINQMLNRQLNNSTRGTRGQTRPGQALNEWKQAQPTQSRQWGSKTAWTGRKPARLSPDATLRAADKVLEDQGRRPNRAVGRPNIRGGGRGGFFHNWSRTVRELIGGRGSRSVSISRVKPESDRPW